MRFRTGRDAVVVNVSNSGVLVEGVARLLPGTHIDVHVVTRDGRVLVRSRVTRAYVFALTGDLICYRGALAFDRLVDTSAAGYAIPSALLALSADAGSAYPAEGVPALVAIADRLTA